MLNVSKMADWLKEKTEWQETPAPLTDKNYLNMIIEGIERLFVDTGRSDLYNEDLYVQIEGTEDYGYDYDFPLDERRYIKICAQMNFFSKVQTDVNNAFGYTTDALSVTHADKPYENLDSTLGKLEQERRIIYYKMVRYTLI